MVDKYIVLDTVLGQQKTRDLNDELLPTQVSGTEAISAPFCYDVTMVRDAANKGLLDPRKLIGTQARFGLLAKGDHASMYSYRTGVFQTFSRLPRSASGCLVYTGRIVPALVMLGRRTRYQVFENKTVVEVIGKILSDMAANAPMLRFDITRLHEQDYVPVEYTVQFGESDFAFLCRLMKRYGMWYIFDQPGGSASKKDAGTMMDAINNTLVIGVGRIDSPNACDWSQLTIKQNKKGGQVNPAPSADSDPPEPTELVAFRRLYEPPVARISGADFNALDPSNIKTSTQQVFSDYDLARQLDEVTREDFAVRADASADSPDKFKRGTLTDAVSQRSAEQECRTFTVTGSSTNATLLPGRSFQITNDENRVEQASKHLVQATVISAYENSYFTTSGQDIAAFFATLGADIASPLTGLFQPGGQGLVDLAFGATQSGLNNYLQNQQALMWQSWLYQSHSRPPENLFWAFTLGGMTQGALGAMVGLIMKGIDDATRQALVNNAGAYTNSFVAVPFRATTGYLAPSPSTETPIARGPQIAVVIGPEGTDVTKGEVYADAIGRVRIRFAWDIAAGRWDGLGKKPLACDDSTCWVRVSDSWAGAKFGVQFLPRIGQEVVVEFLDGDPERPFVSGRLYNAASRLPFPSPGAEDKTVDKIGDLPGTAARDLTRSGIKTRTMGAGAGFHMLRFDDKSGAEQLLLRSQGRLDETAMGSRYETTNGSRHVRVMAGKDKQTDPIEGGSFTTVQGEADLDVGRDFFARVKGKLDVQAAKDVAFELKASARAKISQTLALNADEIVLDAATKLTLKVGGSFVVLTAGAIYINSPAVNVNSGGCPTAATPFDITDPAAAQQADPGTPPNWLQTRKHGSGNGSRTHTVEPVVGVAVEKSGGDLNIGGFDPIPTGPAGSDCSDPNYSPAGVPPAAGNPSPAPQSVSGRPELVDAQ